VNRQTPSGPVNMPAFGSSYSDAEIAILANYVTARFGAAASHYRYGRGAYPARSLAIATRNGFAALRIFTSALLNKSFFSSFCLTLLCVLDAMPDAIFNNP